MKSFFFLQKKLSQTFEIKAFGMLTINLPSKMAGKFTAAHHLTTQTASYRAHQYGFQTNYK